MCDDSTIASRQDLLMTSLDEFFKNKDALNQMLPILNQTAHISLRILDWFVTNYAKKRKIVYQINGQMFNVYLNYKSQLKAFSKKQFDPFCRKIRKVGGKQIYEGIKYYYDAKKNIETTVGQLNFFKWAISNGVLSYIIEHLTDIVDDMILSGKKKKDSEENENEKTISSSDGTTTTSKHRRTKKSKSPQSPAPAISSCSMKTSSPSPSPSVSQSARVGVKEAANSAGMKDVNPQSQKEISISATKTVTTEHVKVVVSFS